MTMKIREDVIKRVKLMIARGEFTDAEWGDINVSLEDLKRFALVIDDDRDPETEAAYKYPLGHENRVYTRAVSSALAYARGARGAPQRPKIARELQEISDLIKKMKEAKKMNGNQIVYKNLKKRLVTAPVLLPDMPDCDYEAGEKVFSIDEVEELAHKYSRFRLVDEMHEFSSTGKVIGEAVESWILHEDLKTKNTSNAELFLPAGTWMATLKIDSEDAWQKIENNTYTGFSASYVSRENAEKIFEAISNKSECYIADKRTLIADLTDPTPVCISVVGKPCVFNAQFISKKEGKKLSKDTLSRVEKIEKYVTDALSELKKLIGIGFDERLYISKETKKIHNEKSGEVKDMEDAEKPKVEKTVKVELTSIDGVLNSIEELNKKIDALSEKHESEKTESEDTIEDLKNQLTESSEKIKELESKNEELTNKLKEVTTASNKIDETVDAEKTCAEKFYEEAGLDILGRPLKE